MKIRDIKDNELKAKAIRYAVERDNVSWREDFLDCDLDVAFTWYKTEEGGNFWAEVDNGTITELPKQVDSVHQAVLDKFEERRVKGIETYGVTLDRKDLSRLEWLNHAQEEAMDLVLYLEKLKQQL